MKKSTFIFILILGLSIISACKGGGEPKEVLEKEDTVKVEPENVDEAIEIKKQMDTSTSGDAEFKVLKKKIEKKYGEQWDFCKCVLLNDSLDRVVKEGKMDDNFMKRFDEVDKHCKSFLVMDETRTPEERAIHDKKIQKCLRSAGRTRRRR